MQTQQKVTYLLGAGASAMALPTYENFKERFLKFKNALRNANIESGNPRVVVNSIITDATNFYNELDYHSTPDTVAKKYFISEQKDKLYRLKVILVIFFFFEQTRKSKEKNGDGHEEEIARFEKRYDNFISRLLLPKKGKFEFESGFNILTWNYDCQFEIGCHLFNKEKKFNDQYDFFHSIPSFYEYTNFPSLNPNSFKVIHLNGVAMATKKTEVVSSSPASAFTSTLGYLGNFLSTSDYPWDVIIELYRLLTELKSELAVQLDDHLSFGWEHFDEFSMPDPTHKPFIEARKICNETDVLVIIGYSFPSLNNTIDSELFRSFQKLHTVYIQTMNFEPLKNLVEKEYLSQKPETNRYKIRIENVGYTNQFFIPSYVAPPEKVGEYTFLE